MPFFGGESELECLPSVKKVWQGSCSETRDFDRESS